MARCIRCGADISAGRQYCEKCEKLNKEFASNESYLDSLLQAITPAEQENLSRREIRKKTFDESKAIEQQDSDAIHSMSASESSKAENTPQTENMEVRIDDSIVSDEQKEPEELLDEEFLSEYSGTDEVEDEFDRLLKEISFDEAEASEEEIKKAAAEFSFPIDDEMEEADEENVSVPTDSENTKKELENEETHAESSELPEGDIFSSEAEKMDDDDFLQLIESLGTGSIQDESNEKTSDNSTEEMPVSSDEQGNMRSEDSAADEKPDDDIMELINQLYDSDSLEKIEDIPNDVAANEGYGTEEQLEQGTAPDIPQNMQSKAYSDAGDGLDNSGFGDFSLDDLESIANLGDIFPGNTEVSGGSGDSLRDSEPQKTKKKKIGFFKRIFGNIKEERTEEEIARLKEQVIADVEAKEAAAEEKKRRTAAEKEAKKKAAEEKKAAAAKKKQEDAKKKQEAAKSKKDEKERKKREIQNLLDEINEDEGRINRVGASIVFLIFAATAAFIVIGTKVYTYSMDFANAQKNFDNRHYTEAYEDIAGIEEVKQEDQTFALQVVTVMIIKKQLDSCNTAIAENNYPKALDSLIKGMRRYVKYYGLAYEISIDDDMDYVRDMLLDKLESVFGITQQEATRLAAIEDRDEYTAQIYEIAGRVVPKHQEEP